MGGMGGKVVRASCLRVEDFGEGMGEWGLTTNGHEWGGTREWERMAGGGVGGLFAGGIFGEIGD